MTNPTSNFGWQMPTSTDLVTDLPADFETFGQAVDTSLADLKGGTSGQVLSKASNTDMDFTWVAQDDTNAIQNAIVDAKGDLIAASAADTPARLAVGADGSTLVADSAASTGLKWALPAMTLVKRASFSSVANTSTTFDGVFSSTYKNYQIVFEVFGAATAADDLHFQFRYAGPTTQATDYFGNLLTYVWSSSTITNNGQSAAQAILNLNCGGVGRGAGNFFINGCSGSSEFPKITGNYIEAESATSSNVLMTNITARIYTGFILKSSSSNISGTVAVYGLA